MKHLGGVKASDSLKNENAQKMDNRADWMQFE
jgi:hypothetical protein